MKVTSWMLRLMTLGATLTVMILMGAAVLVVLFEYIPTFVVVNTTSEPVEVTAHWGGGDVEQEHRRLGRLHAGGEVEFSVSAESTMRFVVRYADGTELTTDDIRFSSGAIIRAEIEEQGVSIEHES